MENPRDIVVRTSSEIFVADAGSHCIRKVSVASEEEGKLVSSMSVLAGKCGVYATSACYRVPCPHRRVPRYACLNAFLAR